MLRVSLSLGFTLSPSRGRSFATFPTLAASYSRVPCDIIFNLLVNVLVTQNVGSDDADFRMMVSSL